MMMLMRSVRRSTIDCGIEHGVHSGHRVYDFREIRITMSRRLRQSEPAAGAAFVGRIVFYETTVNIENLNCHGNFQHPAGAKLWRTGVVR
jgi:hypothetical protein